MSSNRFALRRTPIALAMVALLAGAARALAASPDFDAVTWTPLACSNPDLISHSSPSAADLAGDAAHAPSYVAYDATYLYFRYRVDGDPAGSPSGFKPYAWTALMQVPSGNPFQYQYELALNGSRNTIEIWQNTVAADVSFTPLFHDTPENEVFSQAYDLANGSTVNTTPLARRIVADTSFNKNPDYFLDFAFPVSALVASGAISNASDLASSLFFPATSTQSSNYNKSYLNCPFLPTTHLSMTTTAAPTIVPANHATPVELTITVHNDGPFLGRGLDVSDIALPSWLTNPSVTVSADVPGLAWQVVATNPLHVMIDALPVGATVTIELSALTNPSCADSPFDNVVTVFATNAMAISADALLDIHRGDGFELCDGADNDCNGIADDGGDALCDDGDACNGAEVCAGAAGCQGGTPTNCDDGNACTADACDSTLGCVHTAIADGSACDDGNACTVGETCRAGSCTGGAAVDCSAPDQCHAAGSCDPATGLCSNPPVANGTACNDGNACTQGETCQAGSCTAGTPVVCTALDQCHAAGTCDPQTGVCSNPAALDGTPCNDGDACTSSDSCGNGICGGSAVPGCVPCTTAADCGDANTCTTDVCGPSGTCEHHAVPGCIPCTTAADCDDHDPCTTDACGADGSCAITHIPGCQTCSADADCNDGDACTIDRCEAGVCAHSHDRQCEQGPAEVCGNCIDDDGNGLTDADDPACCAEPLALDLKRLKIRVREGLPGRLRVKARYAAATPTGFDPMTQDTQVQISDPEGQVFCHTVTSPNWKHPRARLFRFKDKKQLFAGGLRMGKFRVKRSGELMFVTRGKQVPMRATDGQKVRVTVRVGNQCATTEMSLRPKRRALVFP